MVEKSTKPAHVIIANRQVAKHVIELPELSTSGRPVEDIIAEIGREAAAKVVEKARREYSGQQQQQAVTGPIDLDGKEEEKSKAPSEKDKDGRHTSDD